MTGTAFALVLLSAATHAYWNFLLKRTGASATVVGLSKVLEGLLLVPILVTMLVRTSDSVATSWHWPVVGAALVLINYVLLTRAYDAGEFSIVYPVSRGATLAFLPLLAFVTIGEHLSLFGGIAVAVILSGIIAMHWPSPSAGGRSLRRLAPGSGFALMAALAASAYTLWDKLAVNELSPVGYFAAYTILVGLVYGVMLLRAPCLSRSLSTLRQHATTIVQVALFNSLSYILVLLALRTEKSTYVIALRQLSIVIGAGLGVYLLNETMTRARGLGIALVVAGCLLIGWE